MIPTGYSFNLDGFSIYLTLAIVFIDNATGTPLSMTDLLTILLVSLITSPGAHGIPGSALVILAATLTGWVILDPIIALLMGANIIWTGVQLLRRSALGLLDSTISREDFTHVQSVLAQYRAEGIQFHALRTRQAGGRSFVSMHVLVPPDWTVLRGHQLLERIERDIRRAMRRVTVFTHLEPQGDPTALDDVGLARDE